VIRVFPNLGTWNSPNPDRINAALHQQNLLRATLAV
jgi:hypothetical protein